MRDKKKFYTPKLEKNPKLGDAIIDLKYKKSVAILLKNLKKIKKFFKLKSFVGEDNLIGNIKVFNREFNKEAIFSPSDYNKIKQEFEFVEVVGNVSEPSIGDIIVHNSILNLNATFTYSDWLLIDDSWDTIGILGIETFEEEDTVGGEYVILANGTTFIINASDYSQISSHWEHVDTISILHDYVEIGGIKWATMNLGANSITDTGLYFQWGDTQGYTASEVGSGSEQKAFTWNDYKYTNDNGSTMSKYTGTNGDGKTVLDASDDAVTAAWGGNWRMPTTAEFQTLGDAVNTAWTQVNGVYGLQCTDKIDSSKVLFFPSCGYANGGSVKFVGSSYWSSSLTTSDVKNACRLRFDSSSVYWQGNYSRFNGFVVRGVLDE